MSTKLECNLSGSFRSTLHVVKEYFRSCIKDAFADEVGSDAGSALEPMIAVSKFGDYQCNNAIVVAKKLTEKRGQKVTPKEVAEEIVRRLKESLSQNSAADSEPASATSANWESTFSSITVSPQGFVTVEFAPVWLEQSVRDSILSNGLKDGVGLRAEKLWDILIDFSSPNIAKEMHVGHLRSTIHGECLARVYEFLGHKVERINHFGDWGTQFGMLIEYMLESHPELADRIGNNGHSEIGDEVQVTPIPDIPDLSDLNAFYKASKARFDSDEAFKDRARKMVVKLQSGDPFASKIWNLLVEISLREFQKIYDRLQVSLTPRGESFYNPMLADIVRMCEEKGLVEVSGGATCLFVEQEKRTENSVPLMLVKSDGGYGYDTTDMAAAYHRLVVSNKELVIYVTDSGQQDHFFKIFDAAKLMEWHKPPKTNLVHVGLGLVLGADGKKFKTRSGETVKLVDLLDEACERAVTEIKARRGEEEELEGEGMLSVEEASQRIGYAAVKYFDLKQQRQGNYQFSFEKVLDPKGNTAVYLLYSYARICSVFRKAGKHQGLGQVTGVEFKITHPQERALCMALLRFPEIVSQVASTLMAHSLCEYMFELCGHFSDFYRDCRIVQSPEEASRLLLCEALRKILYTSFHLLGIQPLPRI